jgi:hypothetical protein
VTKDPAILEALARLEAHFGAGAFVAIDYSDDLAAINIGRTHDDLRLVYFSTFGRAPGRYDVELELPPPADDDLPYIGGGWRYDVDFDTLTQIVASHLGLDC